MSHNLAINVTQSFVTEECISCGVTFALTNTLREWRLRDHKSFYCPNGHAQSFVGESDVEKANRLLREEQDRHARTLTRANEAEAEKARLAKRVKNGVCPCCKRTFQQLARHMAHKHPEFKP